MMNISAIVSIFHALWAVPSIFVSSAHASADIDQFEVHCLPDAPPLPRSWAGRLSIPDTEEGNSLFFWLLEAEDPAYDENLIMWFNGGPGCSSLIGMTTGNGPMSFADNSSIPSRNPYSWTKLGNVLYVDQPAGAGFSTASVPSPVRDNERVTSDFIKWLKNFYAHFPNMHTKRVHMIGESYAGIYIPYFASAIIANEDSLPIDLRSITLGDGTWGNAAAMSAVTIGTYMHSKQQELDIPNDIMSVFEQADQICGFDQVLEEAQSYPPKGKIVIPGNPDGLNYKRDHIPDLRRRSLLNILGNECGESPITTVNETRQAILNSTCEGSCATFSTAFDYIEASSVMGTGPPCFSMYDITDNCSTINPDIPISLYFNRLDVQEALHVSRPATSTSKAAPVEYTPCNSTILATLLGQTPNPEPPAYSILPDLTSLHDVRLHIYAGENDLLINHFGIELSIQNLTWCGERGWPRPPDQLFYVDDAAPVGYPSCTVGSPIVPPSCASNNTDVAGVWGEARGTTYHLFYNAGHSVILKQPGPMFAYVRDIVVPC